MSSPDQTVPPGRERLRRDIDEELRFDIEMRIEEQVSRGVDRGEAERIALREFGDVDRAREYCLEQDEMRMRAIRRATWLQEVRQDLRHAFRRLHRAPGLAFIAIVTIAIGIGANSAMFSVVNAFLLRALPFTNPDEVLRIYGAEAERPTASGQLSAADFTDYKARARNFSVLAAMAGGGAIYTGGGTPEALSGVRVDPWVFTLLGTSPILGRHYMPSDSTSDPASMVMLSHRAWQRLFAADSSIIGRNIEFAGARRTVIGVMPESFFIPTSADAEIFTLLDIKPTLADANRARKFHFLGALGRVRQGISVEAASAELTTIASALAREYPESNAGKSIRTVSLREAVTGDVKPSLLIVFAASVLLLLVAAVNIAGMLLTRAVGRQHEFAVRAALGAGRARLVRQLLTESAVLAFAGGTIGLFIAVWGTRTFLTVATGVLPMNVNVKLDTTLVLWTLVATVTCTMICGLMPALTATRSVQDRLKDGTRGLACGSSRLRARAALLTAQLSLAVVLLTGAGLLVKSLARIDALSLGYSFDSVLQFRITLPGARYSTAAAHDAFNNSLIEQLEALPGVRSAAFAGNIPLHGGSGASLAIEGRPVPERLPEVGYQTVSDRYFEVLQIPLQAGRTFNATDHDNAPDVAIVSASVAKQFWGDQSPIGARIRLGPNPSVPWTTIVGVASDIRLGPAGEMTPTVYVSARQDHWGSASVMVRTTADPEGLIPAVRGIVKSIDPMLAVITPGAMSARRDVLLADRRVPMQIMSAFGLLALGLAGLGVFGTMAYSVASRTREIGLRVALGAKPLAVVGMVLKQGLAVYAIGVGIGAVASIMLGKAIAGILYGTAPSDPVTLVAVAVILLTVTAIACIVPARRAVRIDPMRAMRAD